MPVKRVKPWMETVQRPHNKDIIISMKDRVNNNISADHGWPYVTVLSWLLSMVTTWLRQLRRPWSLSKHSPVSSRSVTIDGRRTAIIYRLLVCHAAQLVTTVSSTHTYTARIEWIQQWKVQTDTQTNAHAIVRASNKVNLCDRAITWVKSDSDMTHTHTWNGNRSEVRQQHAQTHLHTRNDNNPIV